MNYQDLDSQTVEQVTVERAVDHAPLVQIMLEDGPVIGVHPDVCGLIALAWTVEGSVFVHDIFKTESDDGADRMMADGFLKRVNELLAKGGRLNSKYWSFFRTVYGTPAWVQEFSDRMESHVFGGGTIQEFLSQ